MRILEGARHDDLLGGEGSMLACFTWCSTTLLVAQTPESLRPASLMSAFPCIPEARAHVKPAAPRSLTGFLVGMLCCLVRSFRARLPSTLAPTLSAQMATVAAQLKHFLKLIVTHNSPPPAARVFKTNYCCWETYSGSHARHDLRRSRHAMCGACMP